MKKLFVIGNGFDLAHRLQTSYEDFYMYLKSQYPEGGSYNRQGVRNLTFLFLCVYNK